MAKRLKAMGNPNYKNGFEVTIHETMFDYPRKIKKPLFIFVNSMSDLLHSEVPDKTVIDLVQIMKETPWHTYQILTKRSDRILEIEKELSWPDNVWLGVSVESQDYSYRIEHLKASTAKTKFLSIEPLLGPLGTPNFQGIDWVIVGGESGPFARKMEKEWVTPIRDMCIKESIPFFFKQWGGYNKKKNGRLLEGLVWEQMPNLVLATN